MASKQQNSRLADLMASSGLKPKEQILSTPPGERQKEYREPEDKNRRKPEEEQATEKITAYFTPAQYDHLEELKKQYRRRSKKRISINALLRRLVERADIDDILDE